MKNKDEIITELHTLGAGLIAGKGVENVFQVPENYFGQFPGQMMEIIQNMNKNTSLDITIEKSGPYNVPAQYFEQLSTEIISKVRAMDHIIHAGNYSWNDPGKKNPFALPEGYFEQFESRLSDRIFLYEEEAHAEIEAISPLLAGLKQEKAYTVPENYFNSEALSQKAKQQETRVKTLQHPAVKSIKWARWAAAAAVMAIFTLGGFHYLSNNSGITEKPSFEESLAQIPDNRIKDWLSSNMDEADINNLGGSLANLSSITTAHSLNNFSEKEIKDYLETEVW